MTDSCKAKKTLRGYFGLHHQDLRFLRSATDGVLERSLTPVGTITVGTTITGCPPYRPGRALFSASGSYRR
jgi:hypothetical protein